MYYNFYKAVFGVLHGSEITHKKIAIRMKVAEMKLLLKFAQKCV